MLAANVMTLWASSGAFDKMIAEHLHVKTKD